MVVAVTALLAWAVLAFGAVYPWAHMPLMLGIVVLGGWRLRFRDVRLTGPALATALVLAAIGLQVAPMNFGLLREISPEAVRFLGIYDVAFATDSVRSHSLSVDPGLTLRTLAFLALGALWATVCAKAASEPTTLRAMARNLLIVGASVAVIGLAQKATFNGKLLWFWEPQFYAGNGFGPFVNRNHFAGWMLLATAVSLGFVFGDLSRSTLPANLSLRQRLLWFSSANASALLLSCAAVVAMVCSIAWTMSRSGMAGTAVAVTAMILAAVFRSKRTVQKWVLAGYLVIAVLGVVAWRGTDTLVDWYGRTATIEWRFKLWKDTLPALKEFWIAGSGLNTYGSLMMVYPRADITVHPRQAHNDYLQLAVEGGVLVCVPVLILVGTFACEIVRRLRQPQDEMTWWIRMGAVAGICGMAVQELTEFSLQIPGVALLFATCIAIAIHDPAPIRSRRRARPYQPDELQLVTSI